MKHRNWEDAMDALVEEKKMLWEALDNLVSLWDMDANKNSLENAFAQARHALQATNIREEV